MSFPTPREIYTDLLRDLGLGHPLYYPEPYRNAVQGGWTGVSIGDVGSINDEGGFDFEFNVVKKPSVNPDPTSDELDMPRPRRDVGETVSVANGLPLHAELSFHHRLPESQLIVLKERDIRYNDNDCHRGKVIGKHITHTLSVGGQILVQIPPEPVSGGVTFNIECSREKAASLILPNGATRMDVRGEKLVPFFNLARQHGASWLGLFPYTGTSLYLVTGCVKTDSWALMSLYHSSNTGGVSLKFGAAPTPIGAGPSWTWLEAGPADTRHSPDTGDPNRNHCVFLRGFRISKRHRQWPFKRKGDQVAVDADINEKRLFNTNSVFGNRTGTHLAPSSSGTFTGNSGGEQVDDGQVSDHGVGRTASGKPSLNLDEDKTGLNSVVSPDIIDDEYVDDDIVVEPMTEVSASNHPSEIINQHLLRENPSAEFAITHDDQWANVLEIDKPLDEDRLWIRMLEKYEVIVDSDCVFFAVKETVSGAPVEEIRGVSPSQTRAPLPLCDKESITMLHLGDVADLNRSIQGFEKAVRLTPDDKPGRFNSLGNLLSRRLEHLGDVADLNRSIQVNEQAVRLTPDCHPEQPGGVNDLGNSLLRRFEHLGDVADLNRSIQVFDEAVNLTPDGHPDKLNNLGNSLFCRFEHLGDVVDLNRSIQVFQEAVDLTPDGHPDKLNNLGNSLFCRFEHLGDVVDLNRSIQVFKEAINLTPDSHPVKPGWFNNLGISLLRRFERLGDVVDLNRSIQVFQVAVDLTPDGHPDKLNNLGNSLFCRFEHLGDVVDLNRSIQVFQVAVDLTPDGHPDKLNNLGNSLFCRFEHLGDVVDLNRSIQVFKEAINLTPDSHPVKPGWFNNLGISLLRRFERLGDVVDLNRSIQVFEEAVKLTPDGHPVKTGLCNNLGKSLAHRFDSLLDVQDLHIAIFCYSKAAKYDTGPPTIRFSAARQWMMHARSHAVDQVLDSCVAAMNLIPQLAWLGASIRDRHHQIKAAGTVAREAATVAISAAKYELAVEWLEQGRSVVWSQLLQLRSPMDDLRKAHPELASELQTLSLQLEGSAIHTNSDHDPGDAAAVDYYQLAHKRESLLQDIRRRKGFERFLLHRTISELRPAAIEGPIVLLNWDTQRVDALILHPESDDILSVPLPGLALKGVQHQLRNESNSDYQIMQDLLDRPRALEMPPPRGGRCEHMLSAIWHLIVHPILNKLKITTPMTPDSGTRRMWWCPTGPLSSLPIHAAGVYPDGPKLSDFVISSYTPTISALLDGRHAKSITPSQLLTVSLPMEAKLPGTRREVRRIKNHAHAVTVRELCEGAAVPQSVSEAMEQSEWAHFACHGKQDPADPTKSCLLLADGTKLELRDMINLRLENAQFAFLSACETATGNKDLVDEVVHLGAGMLLAGYRGVITTMRSVDDQYAADIADETYRRLFEDYGADSTRAAEALHFAVKRVRRERPEFLFDWVPFIHMGI